MKAEEIKPIYDIKKGHSTTAGAKYYFLSNGNNNVIKAVDYSYSMTFNGLKVYNMGFGDLDLSTDEINDMVNTQNGDVYKVFNSVISTVPMFFDSFPEGMMIVKGSDSSAEFIEQCKLICKRNCVDNCIKSHRRIKIYQGYINKNYEHLNMMFRFYGSLDADSQIIIEDYIPEKKYDAALVLRNNN